jgi:hypothetical protein
MKEFQLEPGEYEIVVARKHWFVFLIELLPYVFIAFIPFLLPMAVSFVPPLVTYQAFFDYQSTFGHVFLGVWLLFTWTSAWGVFTRYYLNAWILTNMRICAIKQRGWFNREVSSLFLSRVQDATTNVTGVFPSLLDIGNITVQSAGTEDEFHMHGIPHPEEMRDRILTCVKEKAVEAPI